MASVNLSGESQAVLLKYGLMAIAAYFAYTQIKKGVSNTIDLVSNLDLNPFDANGFLGLTVPASTPQVAGTDPSHRAALAKIGANIDNYRVWYPLTSTTMPAGTLQVKWGNNKITYYAPKSAIGIWSI